MSRFITAELDILVYWMIERDRIRARKEAGEPKPWTQDPLLRDYRWCNVRRLDDRVSRWLFEHWYDDRHDPKEQLLDAAWARLINWPDALAEISDRRNPDEARWILAKRQERGDKVFTGAYVVPGVAGVNKVQSICDLLSRIDRHPHKNDLLAYAMHGLWSELIELEGLGSFLAGQIVADLAHLGLGDNWRSDRATWAPLGPGSARGINRLLGRPKSKTLSQEEFDRQLPALIDELHPSVETLWADRQLEAMDIQNCLCEFDKYRRLTLGEGKVRNTYDGAGITQASLI